MGEKGIIMERPNGGIKRSESFTPRHFHSSTSATSSAHMGNVILVDTPSPRSYHMVETTNLGEISVKLDEISSRLAQAPVVVKLNRLETLNLNRPIDVIVEPDGDGFTACPVDFDEWGHGVDATEAIDDLKYSIEELYKDLMEDDNFSASWLKLKSFLRSIVVA